MDLLLELIKAHGTADASVVTLFAVFGYKLYNKLCQLQESSICKKDLDIAFGELIEKLDERFVSQKVYEVSYESLKDEIRTFRESIKE